MTEQSFVLMVRNAREMCGRVTKLIMKQGPI